VFSTINSHKLNPIDLILGDFTYMAGGSESKSPTLPPVQAAEIIEQVPAVFFDSSSIFSEFLPDFFPISSRFFSLLCCKLIGEGK